MGFLHQCPDSGRGASYRVVLSRRIVPKIPTWLTVKRIDWGGNLLFMTSITSILLDLVFGGIVALWDSYKVIVALTLSILGSVAFHAFEASPWCFEPSVPPKLFANRTSFIGFILAFDAAMLLNGRYTFYTILPAIQAALPPSEIVSATAMYAFLRSFGFVWGVTVPSLVFNALFSQYAHRISDPAVRTSLSNANAYGEASGAYRANFPKKFQEEVKSVYRISLQRVWNTAIGLALLGFVLRFGPKQLELRQEVDEEGYCLQEKAQKCPKDVLKAAADDC